MGNKGHLQSIISHRSKIKKSVRRKNYIDQRTPSDSANQMTSMEHSTGELFSPDLLGGFTLGSNFSLNSNTFQKGALGWERTSMNTKRKPAIGNAELNRSGACGFSPNVLGVGPSQPDEGIRISTETQQVTNALFGTQLKCLHIQNALQKLLLLRLKTFLSRSASSSSDVKEPVDEPQKKPAPLSESAVHEIGYEGSDVVASADLVPEDLSQPLQALLRCSGIQIALQNRISLWLPVPAMCSGESVKDDGQSESTELSEDECLSVTCSQLERIILSEPCQCEYRRNPFCLQQQNCASSTDTVQEAFVPTLPFIKGRQVVKQVPHGMGKLSTITGQVIYEGEWHEGKRHGKGKALVVSFQSTSTSDDSGCYNGNWKNNMRHGYGSMLFSSGAKYDGQWQYDKMSGCGVTRCCDGAIIEGTWRDGHRDGCGVFTWPHGVTEYRQYRGGSVIHSCPVDQHAAEEMSRKNERSMRVQLLSNRLQELKLEHSDVTDMIEDLRSTQRSELKKLQETLSTIEEYVSGRVAAALHEQERDYAEKFKASAAKLSEADARIVELEMEVERGNKESQLCQICFDRRRDCIIMPCTHLLYCRQCLAEHKSRGKNSCPACRGPINGEINCNLHL